MKVNKRWLVGVALVLVVLVIIVMLGHKTDKPQQKPLNQPAATKNDNTQQKVVLTKAALDSLVKKAANQQYLQDVLTSGPTLPSPKHKKQLLPLQHQANQQISPPVAPLQPTTTGLTAKDASDQQHCSYNGQLYSIGEIVQIDKGWVRCTPSVVIHADGSSQYGAAVWTLRDNLLN